MPGPKNTSTKQALEKARYLCAQKEKCIEDIKQKFYQWGINKNDFEPLITSLIEDTFIDEERFAKAFAKEKFRFNKWGKVKIEFALKQKNIPENYIQKGLNEIPLHEYHQVLEKELIKKLKSLKDADEYTIKSKLVRFAISKGFENGKVFDMVNSMINKRTNK
ncbi:MAG TPA: regulatory protein RecX [Bacteroidales bacterium]|nr:regulatory protein RecX [Bacteroidales bacterium]